jgi:hypothetical protein
MNCALWLLQKIISGVYLANYRRTSPKANAGYTVVAAYYNPTPGISGHLATVRPCGQYSNKNGPVLANVGREVGDLSVFDVFKSEKNKNEVKFYYDPGQTFKFDKSKLPAKG